MGAATTQDTLTFSCPACNTTLTVPAYLAGIRGPCPKCASEISAPVAAGQTADPPAQGVAPHATGEAAPSPSAPVGPEEVGGSPAVGAPGVDAEPAAAEPAIPAAANGVPNVSGGVGASTPPVAPEAARQAVEALPSSQLPWSADGVGDASKAAPPAADPTAADVAPDVAPATVEEPPVVTAEPINPFDPSLIADSPVAEGKVVKRGGSEGKNRSKMLAVAGLLAIGGAAAAAFYFWPRDEGGGDVVSVPHAAPEVTPTPPPAPAPAVPPANPPEGADPVVGTAPPEVVDVDPATESQPAPPQPPAGAPPEEDPAPETPGITAEGAEGARQALDAFIGANSVDERLKYVQSPSRVIAEMKRYYEKHPLEIQPTSVEFKLSGDVPGSERLFHVFQMTTAAQTEAFPVSVEETEAGPKVDWMAFIQFHDNRLGKFIKIPQLEADTFYAIVERRHYFRSDVPDLGSKVCLGIQPPIPGYEGYAFVEKDSPLGAELYQKFQWEHMYFPVLKLQWKRNQDGSQYIEVKELVRESWRADG